MAGELVDGDRSGVVHGPENFSVLRSEEVRDMERRLRGAVRHYGNLVSLGR